MSRGSATVGLSVVLAGAAAVFVGWLARSDGESRAEPALPPPASTDSYSNIMAADYIGPEACGECHGENYELWSGNLHRAMNQLAGDDGAVLGDFSGVTVEYAGGRATFGRDGEGPTMALVTPGGVERRYRVTRTIGSRYLQEYVGIQSAGPEPDGDPIYGREIRLPFGYWLRKRAWFQQQYFDSWHPAEYDEGGAVHGTPYVPDPSPWAARCAWCHNTYPFELRAARAGEGETIGQGTEQFVRYTGSRPDIEILRRDNLLPVDELVTVGISCESCHLGGREHAAGAPIRFAPAGASIELRDDAPDLSGGRRSAVLLNTVCAQCHSTPAPRYPSGAVARNSSEALDMAGGACTSKIRCVDCHNPHRKGPGATAPDQPAQVAACTGCHPNLASEDMAVAHSGHTMADASCLDCHMPRVVQGVTDMVRSHHIGSPTDESMLAAGAPNACNLCHLDRSLSWTLAKLERVWKVTIEPAESWPSFGQLDRPAGAMWLASERDSDRIAAAGAYGRARDAGSLPALIDVLDDPVAHTRMRFLYAIEDVLGRPLTAAEYAPTAAPEVRAAQVRRLRRRPPRQVKPVAPAGDRAAPTPDR